MKPIWIVAVKEWVDGFRDRRALYTLLGSALFGPLMIGFMFSQIASQQKSAQEIKIPVVGREHAPVLMNWLTQQSGVEIVDGPPTRTPPFGSPSRTSCGGFRRRSGRSSRSRGRRRCRWFRT